MSEGTTVEGPVVVEPKLLLVSREVYNTARSFVESSTKPRYAFNVAALHGNTATFKKPGKWELTIEFIPGRPEKRAILMSKQVFIEVDVEPGFKVSGLTDGPLWVRDINEAKKYDIIPAEDVAYARPVSLSEFLEKLTMYVDAAMNAYAEALATQRTAG